MSSFAKIENGKVVQVIQADQDFINSGAVGNANDWIDCSNRIPVLGYNYSTEEDIFYSDKPFPSWTLNEETLAWEPPIAYPDPTLELGNGAYSWNEEAGNWERMVD